MVTQELHDIVPCVTLNSPSIMRVRTRDRRILLEKVADSARKAAKLAEPYKPYGGQFLEFCSISLSTYWSTKHAWNLPEKVANSAHFSAGIIRRRLVRTGFNTHNGSDGSNGPGLCQPWMVVVWFVVSEHSVLHLVSCCQELTTMTSSCRRREAYRYCHWGTCTSTWARWL